MKLKTPRFKKRSNHDKESPLSSWQLHTHEGDDGGDVEVEASACTIIIGGGEDTTESSRSSNEKDARAVQEQLSPYYPEKTSSSMPYSFGTDSEEDDGDDNNNNKARSRDGESSTDNKQQLYQEQKSPRSNLWSNLFFVLGSVLYLVLAIDDLNWAKEARSIPTYVLQADDDVTWVTYRLGQEEEEGGNNDGRKRTLIRSSNDRQEQQRILNLYDDYDWAELDVEVQAALITLGWNEFLWDNDGSAYTETLEWDELTPEQQDAVRLMGWDADWDGNSDDDDNVDDIDVIGTAAPVTPGNGGGGVGVSSTAAPQQTASPTIEPTTNNNGNPEPTLEWDSYQWDDLPSIVQFAAQTLGYNEDVWNYKLPPRLVTESNPSWEDLSPQEQRAAIVLGYDQYTWWYIGRSVDTEVDDDDDNGDDQVAVAAVVPWEEYDWEDLPPDKQAAYEVLGWNSTLWTNGGSADTDELDWNELTPAQQAAAGYLGYTIDTWNGSGDDDDVVVVDDDENAGTTGSTAGEGSTTALPENISQWDEYFWSELPPEIQRAYQALGYDENTWDSGEAASTDELYWNQLTPEQQSAAMTIGYTQQIWNQEDSSSSSSSSAAYVSADDDYVFLVPSSNTWVSRYMIIYFASALCFIIVGMIDLCSAQDNAYFHASMILAGLFGLVSAMMVEKDRSVSTILNLISVHFFLLEGLNICVSRWRLGRSQGRSNNASGRDSIDCDGPDRVPLTSPFWWIPTVLVLADACFVIGAIMDVVLSYFYFERSSDYDLTLARAFGFSTLLWLLSSVLYLLVTLVLKCCSVRATHQQEPVETPRSKELNDMTFISPLPTYSMSSTTTTTGF